MITSSNNNHIQFLKFLKKCERVKTVPHVNFIAQEYTQSDFRNDITTEDELKRVVGRKFNHFLNNAYRFINTYKFISQRKKIINFPIATNSRFLISQYGSQASVSNFISTLIDIDLLKCVNNTYHFNDKLDKNYCKQYIMNKRVQDLLVSLFKKYNIRKPYTTHDENVFSTEDFNISEKDDVRSKGIDLEDFKVSFTRQNSNVNYHSSEELIHYIETKGTNNLIHDYKIKADYINKTYLKDNDTEKIHFNVKVKTDKKGRIRNISSRAYSYLCFYKSHLERCKNKSGLILKDYLDEKYENGYLHYDSRASVYKVNYALNHGGEWLDNDTDLYELLNGDEFEDKELRESFKSTMMYIQFVKSPSQIKNFLFRKYDVLKTEYTDKELIEIIKKLKKNYKKIIGDSLYSEIFIYESCIYIDLYNELSKLGFNVSQVYDSFYIENNKITQYEFNILCDELLKKIVNNLYYSYIKNNNININKDKENKEFNKNIMFNNINRNNKNVIYININNIEMINNNSNNISISIREKNALKYSPTKGLREKNLYREISLKKPQNLKKIKEMMYNNFVKSKIFEFKENKNEEDKIEKG